MKSSEKILSRILVGILEKKGIKEVVISPGSRNAPLIIGFNQNKFFKTYSIIDERSAGFFSLGISKQKQEPVILICTSGSAVLNYYPAISEAFYSNIPLIVISADRPSEWIDQGDGQTIRQKNVFQNHILKSYNLKEGNTKEIIWNNERLINEGINLSKKYKKPIHINVPFSEPLYNKIENNYNPRIINYFEYKKELEEEKFNELKEIWGNSEKKLILVGENQPSENILNILEKIVNFDNSTLVLKESISNIESDKFIGQIDKFLSMLEDKIEEFKPNLLVILGGAIVSKKIKDQLRDYDIKYCWKFYDEDVIEDTYQNLTHIIPVCKEKFFNEILNSNIKKLQTNYSEMFLYIYRNGLKKYQKILDIENRFLDLKIFELIFKKLPENEILHLSNSSAIRYSQLFDIKKSIEVYCNRGTSGIDGSTSTAIGFSQNTHKNNTIITGDISFFYDSNALWNNYIKSNFKVIIINNKGGNIFRIIPGPDKTEELETFFETRHNTKAEYIAKMYNLEYVKSEDFYSLNKCLETFWNIEKATILEIFTNGEESAEVLRKYMSF